MEEHVGNVVFPGQILCRISEDSGSDKFVIGPGLRTDKRCIYATQTGLVRHKHPLFYWVDCIHKRYIPAKGDSVLGTVISKSGDNFKVDVGSSEPANLSYLAFEGATKRNRPDVKIGDIVFAKFSIAGKNVESELVCIDSFGRSKGYGVIRDGGYTFPCSLNLARKILRPDCSLLSSLGHNIPYEISVGVNGRIWIKGRSTRETLAVMNAVLCAEHMTNAESKSMTRQLSAAVCGYGESTTHEKT